MLDDQFLPAPLQTPLQRFNSLSQDVFRKAANAFSAGPTAGDSSAEADKQQGPGGNKKSGSGQGANGGEQGLKRKSSTKKKEPGKEKKGGTKKKEASDQ